MMKKNFLTLFVLFGGLLFAQQGKVGINTVNPQATLHIDGGKDNPSIGTPTVSQQMNDVVITSDGKLGIATNTPSAKLEIQTEGTSSAPVKGFKLVDGNQNEGFVLTTDADGLATWKPTSLYMVVGTFPSIDGAGNMPFAEKLNIWKDTKAFITLSPGKWRIDVSVLLKALNVDAFNLPATDYCFYRFSFVDNSQINNLDNTNSLNTSQLTQDFYRLQSDGSITLGGTQFVSTTFYGPKNSPNNSRTDKYALAQGSFFIYNNSTTTKTYHLVTGHSKATSDYDVNTQFLFERIGGSVWSENSIIAFPMLK